TRCFFQSSAPRRDLPAFPTRRSSDLILTPQGQAYQQIEAVGIVSGTGVPELAHRFVDYVLSEEVQSLIPTTNWMFPVNAETPLRSEEHTSELQSRENLVCRLLLEKKK